MPTLDFHVDDSQLIKLFDKFEKRGTEVLRVALIEAMRQVGLMSVSRFMTTSGRMNKDKLNIRSGRLSRSLLDGFSFSGGLGGAREGIRRIIKKPGGLDAEYGSKVPYARIHEKSGTTHPSVTAKSRRFFWAMWYQTGIDMWKYMALSPKKSFTVKIPARPFLEPALEAAKPKIYDIFQQRIRLLVAEVQR